MPKRTETLMIEDGGTQRAVKVTIDAPDPAELDIQYLAQKAWLTRSKMLTRVSVTVKVERVRR
jgi:hypothetical protein